MILTEENYYTPEADREYMSCSQYQSFLECEAKAMAKMQNRWIDKPSKALIVGNYFHSYFESPEAHQQFVREHLDDIFTKTSVKAFLASDENYQLLVPKADYELCNGMIEALVHDKVMNSFVEMPGENEKIICGELFGTKWRGKLDKYIPSENLIIDYKTVADIRETSYDSKTKQRVSFVQAYGYVMRAAVYTLLEIQMRCRATFWEAYQMFRDETVKVFDFLLLCVSKQDPPDKAVISLYHKVDFLYELEKIRENMRRINQVKSGRAKPKRCGHCDYCRATNKVNKVVPYWELIPEFRPEREEDDYCVTNTPEGLVFAPVQGGMD